MFVHKRKHLNKGEVFSFTAILGNFLVIFFHSSTIPISIIFQRWLFGEAECAITATVFLIGRDLRYLSFVALSVDRFCRIMFPLKYKKGSTLVIISLIIIIILLLVIYRLWYILTSVIFFDVTWPTCDAQTRRDLVSSPATKARRALLSVYLSLGFIPFVFFLVLARKDYRMKKVAVGIGQDNAVSEITDIENTNESEQSNSFENNDTENTNKNQSEQKLIRPNFKRGKKVMLLLFTLLLYGVAISYFSGNSGGTDFALGSDRRAIVVHFLLTLVSLLTPYLDIIYFVQSSLDLKKAFFEVLKVTEAAYSHCFSDPIRRCLSQLNA